jgi:hypothetical protein
LVGFVLTPSTPALLRIRVRAGPRAATPGVTADAVGAGGDPATVAAPGTGLATGATFDTDRITGGPPAPGPVALPVAPGPGFWAALPAPQVLRTQIGAFASIGVCPPTPGVTPVPPIWLPAGDPSVFCEGPLPTVVPLPVVPVFWLAELAAQLLSTQTGEST